MVLGRKGLLFTFMGILLSAFFVILFVARVEPPLDYRNDLIATRVHRLNTISGDIDDYLGQTLEVSTAYALESMTRKLTVAPTATMANNFTDNFGACVLKAQTYCPTITPTETRLRNLTTALEKIISNSTGLVVTIGLSNITARQDYPFEVEVSMYATIFLDDEGYASIVRTVQINQSVPINDFTDPYYTRFANLNLNRNGTIGKNPLLYDINWTREQLVNFINKSEYRYARNGTSYLQRLQNISASSPCCGIEHILNPNDLQNPGSTLFNNRSFVDWKFFQGIQYDTSILFGITGLTEAGNPFRCLKLDQTALIVYNVPASNWTNTIC
ncbi:MAG: hypothetical protein ABIA93_06300 [Candidatus Woesearchaeota archaeon]